MVNLEPRMTRILALQVALDRAGFSPGEIDAQSGGHTERALRAFQRAYDLHVTGELDHETVRSLGPAFETPLRTYGITMADVDGAFMFSSVAELLAERFHTSESLLRYLNAGADFEGGETLMVPNVDVDASLCMTPREHQGAPVVVIVAERAHMLNVKDASGDVIFHAPVTSAGDRQALQVEPGCLPRVSVGGIRLTSWDAMRLASLMDGDATVIVQ